MFMSLFVGEPLSVMAFHALFFKAFSSFVVVINQHCC